MIVTGTYPPDAPVCHCGDTITDANESPLSDTCAECLDMAEDHAADLADKRAREERG